MKTMGLMLSGFLFGVLVACGGSSVASAPDTGDLTLAQVQAAINTSVSAAVAPLQAQINALQSEIPHNILVSKGTAAFGARTYAVRSPTASPSAATSTTFTATFLGPTSGTIFGMTQQVGMSSTNYLFISNADGASESAGLPVTILYEGPNCTGQVFTILAAGISPANVNQGIVFGTGSVGDTVAADYLMLKAGTTAVPDFANSELEAIPGSPTCVNITPGPNTYTSTYPLVLNDQTVSGVPSGPFSTTLGP